MDWKAAGRIFLFFAGVSVVGSVLVFGSLFLGELVAGLTGSHPLGGMVLVVSIGIGAGATIAVLAGLGLLD